MQNEQGNYGPETTSYLSMEQVRQEMGEFEGDYVEEQLAQKARLEEILKFDKII